MSTRSAACLVFVGLSACGGSTGGVGPDGNSASGGPAQDPPGTGVELSGRVLDAVTGVAIAGVEVRLLRAAGGEVAGPEVGRTATLANGEFTFPGVSRAAGHAAAFGIEGYRDEVYAGIEPPGTGDAVLEPVRLVSDDNAGSGGLAGVVRGAVDGSGVGGVGLDFRTGINRRSGEVIASATTAADGSYLTDGLDHGNVTIEVRGEGIATDHATFQVLGDLLTSGRDIAVAAVADAGPPSDGEALRIVLTWGERPRDLDAHLTGPDPGGATYFHVFPGDSEAQAASLRSDATMGFGPETIVLDRLERGVHRYSVFNFSGDIDRPLGRSGARVEVFRDDASVADFAVPAGEGNLWTVFDLDGGRIVPVGTLSRLRNVLDHFPPSGRDLALVPGIPGGPDPSAGGDHR